MKISKKQWAIFGVAASVSIVLGGLYLASQAKKALAYSYAFSRLKINKLNLSNVDFDVFFNLKNPSKLKYKINSVDTIIKIGNQRIATLKNEVAQEILPDATTEIMINAKLSPTEIGSIASKSLGGLIPNITKIGETPVVMDMVLNIGFMGNLLNIKVPYTYSFPAKDILPGKPK